MHEACHERLELLLSRLDDAFHPWYQLFGE